MNTRVLHVVDSLDLGGAQVVIEQLVRHSDRSRFSPAVVALHGRGAMRERLTRLDVPVLTLSPHKLVPLYLPRLLWLLATQRYDVVHCHLLWANLFAKPLAALCGRRIRINHDHCNDKLGLPAFLRALDRNVNALSTHIIAVSESTRTHLIEHEHIAPERVTTIHNGIDTDANRPRPDQRAAARAKFGLGENRFVIGGLGRLTFQKNFALFLEVAAVITTKHPQAEFIIAGAGPDETALRSQAKILGVAVKFTGYLSDPTELWPALDCFLLTSRYEGLPMTILEAMASGVPIVASALDGMREILRDGVNARLVSPNETGAFASAVSDFIEQPTLASHLAEDALTTVRAHFSAETMTRKVEEIYLRCLEVRK